MNFFDIVMAICLLNDPSACREQRLQYESYGSLNECLFEAQFYIAAWKAENAQFDVKTWRCEYAQQTPPPADGTGEGAPATKS
ncbi:hypothetical protein [Chthonobacter rhizosphaerae]|uniref:hypothetical protein n=1 Tax=Chthonobacter rhizosphaerae TaxID=2735553 RepID=UPI0015EF620A|nr:hypothetical protein [Chthonobacter rhizosphaerae]